MAKERSNVLLLKEQLKRELHNSRRIRGRNHAKSGELPRRIAVQGIINISVRLPELCMIKSIEQFGAELQIHSFFDSSVFQKRDVPIVQPRPGEEPPPRSSQRTQCFRSE